MICYVLAMGKQNLGPHVVVGYGIKVFVPRALHYVTRSPGVDLNRGQTQEHAQCARTRSPAAKISRANFIETIAELLLREKKN